MKQSEGGTRRMKAKGTQTRNFLLSKEKHSAHFKIVEGLEWWDIKYFFNQNSKAFFPVLHLGLSTAKIEQLRHKKVF